MSLQHNSSKLWNLTNKLFLKRLGSGRNVNHRPSITWPFYANNFNVFNGLQFYILLYGYSILFHWVYLEKIYMRSFRRIPYTVLFGKSEQARIGRTQGFALRKRKWSIYRRVRAPQFLPVEGGIGIRSDSPSRTHTRMNEYSYLRH